MDNPEQITNVKPVKRNSIKCAVRISLFLTQYCVFASMEEVVKARSRQFNRDGGIRTVLAAAPAGLVRVGRTGAAAVETAAAVHCQG